MAELSAMRVARARRDFENKRWDMRLAWWTAALSRTDKMPAVDAFVPPSLDAPAPPPKKKKPNIGPALYSELLRYQRAYEQGMAEGDG
jgi:hypothetical protein